MRHLAIMVLLTLAPVRPVDAGQPRRTLAQVKLLYVHASWCASCRRFDQGGALARVRASLPLLEVQDVDADTNLEVLQRYGVEVIPALILTDRDGFALGRPRIDLEDGPATAANIEKLVRKMTKPAEVDGGAAK